MPMIRFIYLSRIILIYTAIFETFHLMQSHKQCNPMDLKAIICYHEYEHIKKRYKAKNLKPAGYRSGIP
jgi:hypothetical protein